MRHNRLTALLIIFILYFSPALAQNKGNVNLLIRGDDIGSSHAANIACIDSYKNGIMRSVELMVPGPWFPEAVRLLNENPGLDVGVHLVITSEWSNVKWRPLTHCPSLTDADGYFFPMIWPRSDFPKGTSLKEASWKIEEIEKEFRAQIETAKRNVPHVSHVNCHMGCESCDPSIAELVRKLAKEYGLTAQPEKNGYVYKPLWSSKAVTAESRIRECISTLENLKPGNYLFVEHPGIDNDEMRAIWHKGYENVASDRDAVTKVFTSKEVMKVIREKGINLVSYKSSSEL